MNFREDKILKEAIENQDIFHIKSRLETYIVIYKGNKVKCDEVVNYAMSKSKGKFTWEEDDGKIDDIGGTISDKYSLLKERLVQNFTKDRYERVIELYRKVNNITSDCEEQETMNNETTDNKGNERIVKESRKKKPRNAQENYQGNIRKRKKQQIDQEQRTIMIRVGLLIVVVLILLALIIKVVF